RWPRPTRWKKSSRSCIASRVRISRPSGPAESIATSCGSGCRSRNSESPAAPTARRNLPEPAVSYHSAMNRSLPVLLLLPLFLFGCNRGVDPTTVLEPKDVVTGWYDAGLVEGHMNKLVPSVSLKLHN